MALVIQQIHAVEVIMAFEEIRVPMIQPRQ